MKDIFAFALATPNTGELNQIWGALETFAKQTKTAKESEKNFLFPLNKKTLSEMREPFSILNYKSYRSFKNDANKMLDKYFQKIKTPPKVFIMSYTQALNELSDKNIDAMCRVVKEYYKKHNYGKILTTVLTSRLHPYKYVDIINIPEHMFVSTDTNFKFLENKRLKSKIVITKGIVSNFTTSSIKKKHKQLIEKISSLAKDKKLEKWLKKYDLFCQSSKRVVMLLGGRVNGPEIQFNMEYAKKLYQDAEKLSQCGYSIIIANGPRTPNDITDYLHEKSKNNPRILFHNCKTIATTDEDRSPSRWRIYSGKYEDEFNITKQIGNIYPGIIYFDNTMVMHTADSFASCESTSISIPTAISKTGIYIDSKIRHDCYVLYNMLCSKYTLDWDEFVFLATNIGIEPKNFNPKELKNPTKLFVERVLAELHNKS